MDKARLRDVPFFSSISKRDLAAVAQQTDEIDVPAGKVLAQEGDIGQEFFVIDSGSAEVTRGGEHVADLGPGDFFGEIGLLERALRTATVTATSHMRLITLTGWDMKRMEKAIPEAVEEIRRVLEERRPAAS